MAAVRDRKILFLIITVMELQSLQTPLVSTQLALSSRQLDRHLTDLFPSLLNRRYQV